MTTNYILLVILCLAFGHWIDRLSDRGHNFRRCPKHLYKWEASIKPAAIPEILTERNAEKVSNKQEYT